MLVEKKGGHNLGRWRKEKVGWIEMEGMEKGVFLLCLGCY